MKLMKTLGAFALAIALAAPLQARDAGKAPNGERRGGRQMKSMATELNLTNAQKTRIKAIMQDARNQRAAMRKKNLSPEQTRTARRNLGMQTRTRIAAVLTPAQKK